MDFIFILLGINTLFIFLYKREWLLQKQPFIIVMACNLTLFMLGYVLPYYSIVISEFVVALKMPLLSQLLFLSLAFLFRKIYDKDAVDTFWVNDLRLMKDGVFNFIFWVTGIMLPAVLVFGEII